MSSAKTFEDMDTWKRARKLVRGIYAETGHGEWSRDFGLRDQIRRAVVSILSNIAEGFDRESNKEFARFVAIAKGSSSEVRSQLYVALDLGYISQATFDQLSEEAKQIGRMLGRFHQYLITASSFPEGDGKPETNNQKPATKNP